MADDGIPKLDISSSLEPPAQIFEPTVRTLSTKEESKMEVEHRQEINKIKLRQRNFIEFTILIALAVILVGFGFMFAFISDENRLKFIEATITSIIVAFLAFLAGQKSPKADE